MSGSIVSPAPDLSRPSLSGVEITSAEYLRIRRVLAQELMGGTVDADHALAVADLIFFQTKEIEWATIAAFHDIGKNTQEAQFHRRRYGNDRRWTEKQRRVYRHIHCELGPRELATYHLREFQAFRRSMESVCLHHHTSAVLIPNGPDKDLVQRVQVADFYETLMVNSRTGNSQPKFTREDAVRFMLSISFVGALDYEKVREFIAALKIRLDTPQN